MLRVVLVDPRNPLNIGAAARAMADFGFSDLALVNPYDAAYREARSAVDAASVIKAAREFPTVADAVADCVLVLGTTAIGHRTPALPVRQLEPAARIIRRQLKRGPVALLFGSEKFGLSNEDLAHCHWLVHIRMAHADLSMNLGQAVAVCLYEIGRRPVPAEAPKPRKPVTAGDLEQITRLLLDAASLSGYINPVTAASAENKLRRLVRRLTLSGADAALLLGLLRQFLWKLGKSK
jgi:TrmH family RNA methyltransferase